MQIQKESSYVEIEIQDTDEDSTFSERWKRLISLKRFLTMPSATVES